MIFNSWAPDDISNGNSFLCGSSDSANDADGCKKRTASEWSRDTASCCYGSPQHQLWLSCSSATSSPGPLTSPSWFQSSRTAGAVETRPLKRRRTVVVFRRGHSERCSFSRGDNGRTSRPDANSRFVIGTFLMIDSANIYNSFLFFYTVAKKMMLLETQKAYKIAALKAKKQGDLEQARLYLRTSKVCMTRSTEPKVL